MDLDELLEEQDTEVARRLRQIADLPGLIEAGEHEQAASIFDELFWKIFNQTVSLTADRGDWGRPGHPDLDLCGSVFLDHLRQAQRLHRQWKTDRTYDLFDSAHDSLIACLRLLPVMIGASMDELRLCGLLGSLLDEPILAWCRAFGDSGIRHRAAQSSTHDSSAGGNAFRRDAAFGDPTRRRAVCAAR